VCVRISCGPLSPHCCSLAYGWPLCECFCELCMCGHTSIPSAAPSSHGASAPAFGCGVCRPSPWCGWVGNDLCAMPWRRRGRLCFGLGTWSSAGAGCALRRGGGTTSRTACGHGLDELGSGGHGSVLSERIEEGERERGGGFASGKVLYGMDIPTHGFSHSPGCGSCVATR
jgi:hypothetical protein